MRVKDDTVRGQVVMPVPFIMGEKSLRRHFRYVKMSLSILGGKFMTPKEKSRIKYQTEYDRNHYDRIVIVVPKGKRDRIKRRANELGKSVNGYIGELIDKDMEAKR